MLEQLIAWIDSLRLHHVVRELGWFVPSIQIIHIIAVSIVFGSALVLSLRTYGLVGGDWTPAQWSHRLKGWMAWSVVVLLCTGLAMILGEPERTITNRPFQAKMLMLIIAIGVWALLIRRMEGATTPRRFGLVERGAAVILMLLIVLIMLAGRWIAYT